MPRANPLRMCISWHSAIFYPLPLTTCLSVHTLFLAANVRLCDWSGNESAKRPTVKTNNTKNISNTMNYGHKSYRNMRIMTPIVNVLLYDNASYNGVLCRILCGYQIKSKHKLSNTSASYITIILFTFTVFAKIRLECVCVCVICTAQFQPFQTKIPINGNDVCIVTCSSSVLPIPLYL